MMNPEKELNALWDEYPEHRTDFLESVMLAAGYQLAPRSSFVIDFMKGWNKDHDIDR